MKRDVCFVFVGVVISSIFFYVKEPTKVAKALNSEEQGSELNKVISEPVKDLTAIKTNPNLEKLSDNNRNISAEVQLKTVEQANNDSYNFAAENDFKFETLTFNSGNDFETAFELQEIDHDWKHAVENKLLSEFSDALHQRSAWIGSYECKYSLCRVEINKTELLDDEENVDRYIMDAMTALSKETNTLLLSSPDLSSDKDSSVIFLVRQEAKSDSN